MSRAGQRDTQADIELRECLATPRRNFVMVAGAGSGKTTSLIKALSSIVDIHGVDLAKRRQRVACITYTEIAAGEIWTDVGHNPLVHVSTIHSFMWSVTKSFQADIRNWVADRIEHKLVELREAAANFGPRVQERTREKNRRDVARYEAEKARIPQVASFSYGTGSNYARGILGHDDIIRIATQFLLERKLFRSLLAQQFPFVFVDESQDTTAEVVSALKAVAQQTQGQFCLGFFGDPMQRIYVTGSGAIAPEENWRPITKPENFRCPTTVLAVANAIRRTGDDVVQVRGRTVVVDGNEQPVQGTARLFVLPADDRRDQLVAAVRSWLARENDKPSWAAGVDSDVKMLVIVHRMAAKRLGFGELYAALNDQAPDAFKNGFLDGTAWPLRPFLQCALPLSNAVANGKEFDAMSLLRRLSPRLGAELHAHGLPVILTELRQASIRLAGMMRDGSTVGQVLMHLRDRGIVQLDPRILAYLGAGAPAVEQNDSDESEQAEVTSMQRYLACPATELWGYQKYIEQQSPFSTQQGIKGAEFDKVLVIADDEEGTHTQFSYDKYFGVKPLSERDEQNIRDRKETSVERTRRLFYVCCTRAKSDLAVIYFTDQVAAAKLSIGIMGIFDPAQIFGVEALNI